MVKIGNMYLLWKIFFINSAILVGAEIKTIVFAPGPVIFTVCQIKHQEDLAKCSGMMGCFITACETDGEFSPYQCHGSVCWCVDLLGNEISNSRTPIGSDLTKVCQKETSPIISVSNLVLTPCQLKHQKELDKCGGMMGCSITSCENDGSFTSHQCHGSVCWCVDNQGIEISNSRIPIGSDLIKACQKTLHGNPASLYCTSRGGKTVIRSTSKGEIGYCVFSNSMECEEWSLYKGECKIGAETACELIHSEDLIKCDGKMGCFISECEADGSFSPLQCLGSVCWCVDIHGEKISGTETSRSKPTQLCTRKTVTGCQRTRQKDIDKCGPNLGCFITNCEPDGSFSSRQCQGSLCWCVDQQGKKIAYPATSIGTNPKYACLNENKSPCELKRQKDLTTCGPSLGCFITTCEPDGLFSPRQCHGSGCWCVDVLGEKIIDTTHPISTDATQICPKELRTTCELNRQKDLTTCGPRLGCFITVCEPDGSFNLQQCQGSMCWCVDIKGKKISDKTFSRTASAVQICRKEPTTSCHRARQKDLSKCQGRDGCFISSCKDDGSFSPRQCGGGACWCADAQGGPIISTLTSVGNYNGMACPQMETSKTSFSSNQKSIGTSGIVGIVLGTVVLLMLGFIFFVHHARKSDDMQRDYTEFENLAPPLPLR